VIEAKPLSPPVVTIGEYEIPELAIILAPHDSAAVVIVLGREGGSARVILGGLNYARPNEAGLEIVS
jgi:hypothetical protein